MWWPVTSSTQRWSTGCHSPRKSWGISLRMKPCSRGSPSSPSTCSSSICSPNSFVGRKTLRSGAPLRALAVTMSLLIRRLVAVLRSAIQMSRPSECWIKEIETNKTRHPRNEAIALTTVAHMPEHPCCQAPWSLKRSLSRSRSLRHSWRPSLASISTRFERPFLPSMIIILGISRLRRLLSILEPPSKRTLTSLCLRSWSSCTLRASRLALTIMTSVHGLVTPLSQQKHFSSATTQRRTRSSKWICANASKRMSQIKRVSVSWWRAAISKKSWSQGHLARMRP